MKVTKDQRDLIVHALEREIDLERMSDEEIYWEEQEYNRAMEIMQKDIMNVTKEEIEFLKKMNMI